MIKVAIQMIRDTLGEGGRLDIRQRVTKAFNAFGSKDNKKVSRIIWIAPNGQIVKKLKIK